MSAAKPVPEVVLCARLLALAEASRPGGLLTTADIRSYAAQCLARMRADGDRLLSEARASAGQQQAYVVANRISRRLDEAGALGILALLATRHDDAATGLAIEADISATSRQLIEQAHAARTLSIPKVAA